MEYEREPFTDRPEGSRPSIGEALEVPYKPMDVPRDKNLGKLDNIAVGCYVMYVTDRTNKKCRVGLVLTVARTEKCVVVHRMEPKPNMPLRVKWYTVYLDSEGQETAEPTAKPSTARLDASTVLDIVTISRDGVLGARAARRFDHQNWTLDDSTVEGTDTARHLTFYFSAHNSPEPAGAVAPLQPETVEAASQQFLEQHTVPCRTKIQWAVDETPSPYILEGFADYMELWSPGAPFSRELGLCTRIEAVWSSGCPRDGRICCSRG